MNRYLILVLGLLVALVIAVLPTLEGGPASAGFPTVSYTLSIGTLTMSVGSEDSVDLQAANIDGSVGGWIIDIEYDADIVSVAECVPIESEICELQFDAGTIRVSGASVAGLTKDTTLAVLTFRCESQGDSPLLLNLQGGSGIPEIIVEVETLDGNITCESPSEATVTGDDAASPTGPPSLPATGVRGGPGDGALTWLIAAWGGVALGALAVFSALWLRQ